jgi:3-deoxy-7-phosphoheptulonate synthase
MHHVHNLSLAAARADIDLIDDQILELLERRLSLSRRIAAAKDADDDRLKLCPKRQRRVVERLQARGRAVPAAAIAHVWREVMAHSLEAQAPTRFVTCTREDVALRLREAYGSAPEIAPAQSPEAALAAALEEEAVAVLDAGHSFEVPDGLVAFETLGDAVLVGRVAPEEAAWRPASWRARPAAQLPHYPDEAALRDAEARLAAAPALVPLAEVERLKAQLAEVAAGRAFLVQGGECAEGLGALDPAEVAATAALLRGIGREIGAASGLGIVHLARLAGQFAKPRSSGHETVGGVTLPAYRGDGVNGAAFTAEARTPDPQRMLRAWSRSRETLDLLGGMPASHEALLLPYEEALTRRDAETGKWWASSAHMIWIGERTRDLGGAHVEYASGVANPVGVKCGPGMAGDDLLRLLDRLDPEREAGRIVLIPRMGRANVYDRLPGLMRAVAGQGRRLVWAVDPMHGNARTEGGRKTRHLTDILVETAAFFDIAAAEGIQAGGLHLELSGTPVSECIGGAVAATEEELAGGYRSLCDPRLNPRQAMDVAGLVAQRLAAPVRARAA